MAVQCWVSNNHVEEVLVSHLWWWWLWLSRSRSPAHRPCSFRGACSPGTWTWPASPSGEHCEIILALAVFVFLLLLSTERAEIYLSLSLSLMLHIFFLFSTWLTPPGGWDRSVCVAKTLTFETECGISISSANSQKSNFLPTKWTGEIYVIFYLIEPET